VCPTEVSPVDWKRSSEHGQASEPEGAESLSYDLVTAVRKSRAKLCCDQRENPSGGPFRVRWDHTQALSCCSPCRRAVSYLCVL